MAWSLREVELLELPPRAVPGDCDGTGGGIIVILGSDGDGGCARTHSGNNAIFNCGDAGVAAGPVYRPVGGVVVT